MEKFSYRVFNHQDEVLLAIADKSILGMTCEDGDLSITVSDFYAGRACDSGEALKLIKRATIVNAVGREIIALLIREKCVGKDSVLKIGDMPHAQIVAFR